MSDSSVVTNEEGMLKRGCNSDACRCKFAIEDPLLTMSLPQYQTMCGCTDIMMHTMERYFVHESMRLTDEIAIGLLRTVRDAALILKEHPGDYDQRANVMFASSLSHNGLTAVGNETKGDWACHHWNTKSVACLMSPMARDLRPSGRHGRVLSLPPIRSGSYPSERGCSASSLRGTTPTTQRRRSRQWNHSIGPLACLPT